MAADTAKKVGVVPWPRVPPGVVGLQDRYALLIGAGEFKTPESKSKSLPFPPLPECANDVRRIKEVLVDPLRGKFPEKNVQTLVGKDATRGAISDARERLRRILADRQDDDALVLILFSGHAFREHEHGSLYWITFDTDRDNIPRMALSSADIAWLNSLPHCQLVFLVDCCYAGAVQDVGADGQKGRENRDLETLPAQLRGSARLVISSSNKEQFSGVIRRGDTGRGFSVFSWAVIEGLSGAAATDQQLEGTERLHKCVLLDGLWTYIVKRTPELAKQEGYEQTPTKSGNEQGRLLLTFTPEYFERSTASRCGTLGEMWQQGHRIDSWEADEGSKLFKDADDQKIDKNDLRYQIFADLVDRKIEVKDFRKQWWTLKQESLERAFQKDQHDLKDDLKGTLLELGLQLFTKNATTEQSSNNCDERGRDAYRRFADGQYELKELLWDLKYLNPADRSALAEKFVRAAHKRAGPKKTPEGDAAAFQILAIVKRLDEGNKAAAELEIDLRKRSKLREESARKCAEAEKLRAADPAQARDLLDAVLEKDKDNATARRLLTEVKSELDDLQRRRDFEKRLEDVRALDSKGQFDKAREALKEIEALKEVEKLDPGNLGVNDLRLIVEWHAEDARVRTEKHREEVSAYLKQAKQAKDGDNPERGIVLLDELLRIEPTHEEAKQLRQSLMLLIAKGKAKADQERQVTELLQAAEQYAQKGNVPDARKAYEDVLALKPGESAASKARAGVEVMAHLEAARKHFAAAAWSDALAELEKANDLAPGNQAAQQLHGEVETARDNRVKAVKLLREGKELKSRDNVPGALAKYKEAASIDPTDEARKALDALDGDVRGAVKDKLDRAKALMASGDNETARKFLSDALQLDPEHPDAKQLLPKAVTAAESDSRRRESEVDRLKAQAAGYSDEGNPWEALRKLDAVSDRRVSDRLKAVRDEIDGLMKGADAAAAAGNRAMKDLQFSTAFNAYNRAAKGGSAEAMRHLAEFYCNGTAPVPTDKAKGRAWYERAAGLGDLDAMKSLAKELKASDPTRAAQWSEKAADAGDRDSMLNVAKLYEAGDSVTRNDARAEIWYRRAALKDDAEAMDRLGRIYERKGETQTARDWFAKAAKLDNADAKDWLVEHKVEHKEAPKAPQAPEDPEWGRWRQ